MGPIHTAEFSSEKLFKKIPHYVEALTFVETYISRVEGGDPLKCELKGSTTTLLLILAQLQQKVKIL